MHLFKKKRYMLDILIIFFCPKDLVTHKQLKYRIIKNPKHLIPCYIIFYLLMNKKIAKIYFM